MKRLILMAALMLGAGAAFTTNELPAFGADNGTVEATVTVAGGLCLQLGASSVDFGTQDFSDVTNDAIAFSSEFSVENCGSDPHAVWVRGTDATAVPGPGATWALQGPLGGAAVSPYACDDLDFGGINTYFMTVGGTTFSSFADLSTANSFLVDQVPAQHDIALSAMLMPCTGSDGAGQTMGMDMTFVALP